MYKVKILDIREFMQAGEAWNRLVMAMDNPSIFSTWEWIYTWWEQFGSNYEPLILAIYGDELKGILPLAMRKASSNKDRLKGRVLSYCGSIELCPDHIDIISRKKDAGPCMAAAFDFLQSAYTDWDVLDVSLITEESGLMSCLDGSAIPFEPEVTRRTISPFIRLSGGIEEYGKKINGTVKNIVRRKQKKLQALGIEYLSRHPSGDGDALKTLFRLHGIRAREKGITSTFDSVSVFDFHNALISRINGKNWHWLRFLGDDKKIISAIYCFALRGRLLYYQMGFDPEWESYSPGTVLMHEVIKEAFSKGFQEFDFLRGDEEFKRRWTEDFRVLYSLKVYNKTINANIFKNIHRSKNLLKNTIRKIIH